MPVLRNRKLILSSYVWEEKFRCARDTISDKTKDCRGVKMLPAVDLFTEREIDRKVWLRVTCQMKRLSTFFRAIEEAIESGDGQIRVFCAVWHGMSLGNREMSRSAWRYVLGGFELNSSGAARSTWKPYVCKIARNNALDRVREKNRANAEVDSKLVARRVERMCGFRSRHVALLENAEMAGGYQWISARQTEQRRYDLHRNAISNASGLRDIAEEHDMTRRAVKSLMHRMRRSWKEEFIKKGVRSWVTSKT